VGASGRARDDAEGRKGKSLDTPHHIDEPPLPRYRTWDPHAFRTSCHVAVRALGGRIVSAEAAVRPANSANDVRTTVELPSGRVSIVLNSRKIAARGLSRLRDGGIAALRC
jgi:hypothetical protein